MKPTERTREGRTISPTPRGRLTLGADRAEAFHGTQTNHRRHPFLGGDRRTV